mgnify:CR=1 FL=1
MRSLRDAIDLIVKAYRAFVSCALVYCDVTATLRKVYVLTIESTWVGAADIGDFPSVPLRECDPLEMDQE